MTATSRLELRLDVASRERLQRAADLQDVSLSEFVRAAAAERADRVLSDSDTVTVVPAAFFDELMASLDDPPVANEALVAAARRSRAVLTPPRC